MAKSKKRIDNPNQLSIFDYINEQKTKQASEKPRGGSLNIDIEERHLISDILKRSRWSRYEIAARMSEYTGEEITKSQLDSWTAESKQQWRFPSRYLPAFRHATDNTELIEFHCKKAGLFVVPDTDALRAEIKHLEEDIEKKKQEKKKRIVLLQEVEGRNGR